jgi:hypothetical protein
MSRSARTFADWWRNGQPEERHALVSGLAVVSIAQPPGAQLEGLLEALAASLQFFRPYL